MHSFINSFVYWLISLFIHFFMYAFIRVGYRSHFEPVRPVSVFEIWYRYLFLVLYSLCSNKNIYFSETISPKLSFLTIGPVLFFLIIKWRHETFLLEFFTVHSLTSDMFLLAVPSHSIFISRSANKYMTLESVVGTYCQSHITAASDANFSAFNFITSHSPLWREHPPPSTHKHNL